MRDFFDQLIARLLEAERIAVVGISDDPSKPSNAIAQYLIDAGYDVVGVNPNLTTVLDRPCYTSLKPGARAHRFGQRVPPPRVPARRDRRRHLRQRRRRLDPVRPEKRGRPRRRQCR